MKRMVMLTVAIATGMLAGPVPAALAQQKSDTARSDFIGRDGKETGRAQLTVGSNGVFLEVEISGLEPRKWTALHTHDTGTYDAALGHESAHGHFTPDGRELGCLTAHGHPAG